MKKTRVVVALSAMLIAGATSLAAQSTGPQHEGYDPNAPRDGHVHVGEIGEKLMAIETALKCNCGCGLDVHSCQFAMQCGTSPVWTMRILEALEAGQDEEAIKASFVAEFGPTVLMAPPAEGFNLLVYVLPVLGLVTAGMLVGLVARGGTKQAVAVANAVSDADAARIDAEMKKLDELESPDW